jgi:hypothetical protein
MKILLLDIENSPEEVRIYGPARAKYIGSGNLVKQGEILCFAAKWLGRPKIFFHSVHKDGKPAMLAKAWDLLDEADAVMTYYGRRHDIPILNREFLLAGMTPPSPYRQIDLYFVVRQTFGFPYKSLDYVSHQLGLSGKTMKLGLPFIVACMEGDERAWQKMAKYNKQDVRLLEELYVFLQPWVKGHPSHGAHEGADVCPKCGSDDLERRGFSLTAQGKYQRFRCQNCGGWSRSSKRLEGTQIVEAA